MAAVLVTGLSAIATAQGTVGTFPSSVSATPAKAAQNIAPQGTTPHGAPEISPSLAAAGLFLLLGGTVLLVTRRRKATA